MSHPPSAPDPRPVPPPTIHFSLFSPFFQVILTPPPPVNTRTPLLCTLNSCLFGAPPNFCSVLKSPPRSQPHSSLGNVDLFLTSSSRSEASGERQRGSAKKKKKNVWEWSTWEREGASNCFSFLFFSFSSGIS